MIPLLSPYYSEDSPSSLDVFILHKPMVSEVLNALPMPGSVEFCSIHPGDILPYAGDVIAGWDLLEYDWLKQTSPVLVDGMLLIPALFDGQNVFLIAVYDIDPDLLARMSKSWLMELHEEIGRRFDLVKKGFTDSDTGMFNKRALEFLDQMPCEESTSLLLMNIGTPGTSVPACLRWSRKVADILYALNYGALFSLGGTLYAILLRGVGRAKTLKMVNKLQRHFKREGGRRVQVGFDGYSGQKELLATAWSALLAAEKRGPFGVCDAKTLVKRPFDLPSEKVVKKLRRLWRGMRSFYLAAFQWQDDADSSEGKERLMSEWLSGTGQYSGTENGLSYVVFTDEESEFVQSLTTSAEVLAAMKIRAVGICMWPCLSYSKTEAVKCAHKALQHCSFLEFGAGVIFDQLTLNISGDVYFDMGDYQSAARDYRKGLQLDSEDINLLNSLGVTLVEFNQYAAAMSCFRNVLNREPENTMALVNLGYVQQTTGMKNEAVSTLEKAVGLMSQEDVNPGEVLLPLSRLYIDSGRYAESVQLLEKWAGIQGNEKEYILFRLLALCYFELDCKKQAEDACRQALRSYPNDSVSLSVLGVLYVEGGQGNDIGLRLCQKALEIDPASPDNYQRLGRAFFHTGEDKRALEAVKQCLQLQRGNIKGLILLARIHMKNGGVVRAKKILERVTRSKVSSEEQRKLARKYFVDIESNY